MKYIKTNESPYIAEAEALVVGLGYTLVDYSLERLKSRWHASVVIFSPNGIGIEDCTKVHKPLQQRLEVLLDSQDLTMEVSSPGVARVLKKSYEFKAFIGQKLLVWDLSCTDWVSGKLIAYSDEGVTLETSTETKFIPFSNIKKAKLSNEE